MVDKVEPRDRAGRLEIDPRKKLLVLVSRVSGKEAEGGADPERCSAGGRRRRDDEPAAFREKRRRPDEDLRRLRKVLEEREEEDDVEGPRPADLVRDFFRFHIPEDETRLRMAAAVLVEDLAAPVAAEVRTDPSGKGGQAAADVEKAHASCDERPDGGEPGLDEGACQEAVEPVRRAHETLFSTDAVRSGRARGIISPPDPRDAGTETACRGGKRLSRR